MPAVIFRQQHAREKISPITYHPTASVFALHFRVLRDLVEVVVEEHPRRVRPLLGGLEVGEVVDVDGVTAGDVCPVFVLDPRQFL